jgi:hypothetical protein
MSETSKLIALFPSRKKGDRAFRTRLWETINLYIKFEHLNAWKGNKITKLKLLISASY